MSAFSEALARDARLSILQLLAEANANTLNSMMLGTALDQIGVRLSLDQLRGELAWLEEMRLITRVEAPSFTVATLTEKGFDVARGRSSVPGVSRPIPGAG